MNCPQMPAAIRVAVPGPARFDLVSHVNAPVADLPARRILGGRHFVADLTLPAGRVLVDYLQDRDLRQAA